LGLGQWPLPFLVAVIHVVVGVVVRVVDGAAAFAVAGVVDVDLDSGSNSCSGREKR
jgi:hypothetical protein